MNKLEALFDAVIVKPLEIDEKMYGSIFIPDAGKDRNEQGEVVAVGPGRHVAGVGYIETEIKIGDIVVLPTMGFAKLQFEGEEYFIGPENQILARINTEENTEENE
jgi:chaperonin GroES